MRRALCCAPKQCQAHISHVINYSGGLFHYRLVEEGCMRAMQCSRAGVALSMSVCYTPTVHSACSRIRIARSQTDIAAVQPALFFS